MYYSDYYREYLSATEFYCLGCGAPTSFDPDGFWHDPEDTECPLAESYYTGLAGLVAKLGGDTNA
jgi:hypothetical protein